MGRRWIDATTAAPDLADLADPARSEAVANLIAAGPASPAVRRLTSLAARLLAAPFAQVSLIGAADQVVAASYGFDVGADGNRSPLADSLCSITAASGEPLVIDDAPAHPWVRHLPPVASGAVVSYLGVVLRDRAGHVLGSLCVYDRVVRAWTDEQVATLGVLAADVATSLAEEVGGEADAASVRLELAVAAANLGSYEYDLRTGQLSWDDRMLALHGYAPGEFQGGIADFNAVVHPEDLPTVQEQMAQAIDGLGELIVDYRVRLADGGTRWVNARGRVLPDLVGEAARILGAAYDRSAERSLQEDLTRLLETMPAGFLRCRDDWTITFVNRAALRILAPRTDVVGINLWEVFPEARGTAFDEVYHRARDTQRPDMVEAYFAPLDTHFEVHVWPDPSGLSFFFHDVSDRTTAHGELETTSARLALLAGAGPQLSASLMPAEVLGVLAELIVPDLAVLLVLVVVAEVADLLGQPTSADATRLYPVHLAHADPDLQPLLAEAIGRVEVTTRAPSGVGRAVRTGQAQAMVRVPEELLAQRALDEVHLGQLRALNTGPSFTVPLLSPRGPLGALTVCAAEGHDLDELLLGDLANRAAVALDNALAFARQSRAASDLQQGLLPRAPAGVPGVEVATRYLPAATGALAGGDFFKTVRVGGRLVAVLGDVMGHGSVSAARAGQLHSVVAALALEGHGPAALLDRLAADCEQILDLDLATLVVCAYDPDGRTLTTATAGHPAPLVAPQHGEPFFLDLDPGPPIGVATGTYPETICTVDAGATVLLFSDGLVERRGENISDGLERLRRAVAELRQPPEAVADHVIAEMRDTRGGEDDIALLVLSHP